MSQAVEPSTPAPAKPEKPAKPKIVWTIWDDNFNGPEPWFYNREDFPWVKLWEDNWEAVYKEILANYERGDMKLNSYFNKYTHFPPGNWKGTGFFFWGWKIHDNLKKCPTIESIIKRSPLLTGASVSCVEAESQIRPHHGDNNAIIRSHLALEIPAGPPDCAFMVGKETRAWIPGQMLLFCDAHFHASWNHTKKRRLIMIIDYMREEFAHLKYYVCCNMLAKHFLQWIYNVIPASLNWPKWIQKIIHGLMTGVFMCFLWAQNLFGGLFSKMMRNPLH